MKNKLFYRILSGVLLLILIYLAIYLFDKPITNELNLNDSTVYVQTTKPIIQPMALEFKTVASIKAKNDIELTSGLKGAVEKILTPSAAKVKQGDSLIKLKPDATIKAPISGTLSKWEIKNSQYIQAGEKLVTIVDKSILVASYYVPEHYADKLAIDQEVKINSRAFGDKDFHGMVTFISPIIDDSNNSILVEVEIINTSNKLLPGMFTRITHILDKNPNAITIPEPCIIKTLDSQHVFVVKDNTIEKKSIKTYRRQAGMIEIIEGIAASDEIVLTIPPGLTEGQKVTSKIYQGSIK